MVSQPSQRLAQDHEELDDLLRQLQQALNGGDLPASHARLDLFWARLAVHIRAEHLHLFPAVIGRLNDIVDQTVGPSVSQAQAIVDRLRADHDFFMHELARAIGILRDLTASTTGESVALRMKAVQDAIIELEQRLVAHNEIEERQIYGWATALFDRQEQMELLTLINDELAHHPPRFTLDAWSSGM